MAFWRGDWFSFLQPAYEAKWLGTIVNYFSSFHVHTFTMVSGFIYYHVRYNLGGYKKFGSFLKKKSLRLLIPYVFVAVIWVVPTHIAFYGLSGSELLHKFLLGESPSQLWFLLMLFDVFVISWLLSECYKKSIWSVIIPLIFYGIAIVGTRLFPNIFNIWNACRHMIMFWLGFKFCQENVLEKIKTSWIPVMFVCHLLLFFAFELLSTKSGIAIQLISKGIELLMRISGTLMAFTVLQRIAAKVNWKQNIFMDLSRKSMSIYLLHQQVIYLVLFFVNGHIPPILNVVVNFIIALVVSWGLSTVLLIFKPTRFLLGEKP